MPPTDPLEQYLLDHENDMHMHEINEIDKNFFEQRPLLKHNFPIETLGGPPPPKGDPVFNLKHLSDTLKYANLDEKKIYHVNISANLTKYEEKILLKFRGSTVLLLGILLMILRALAPHSVSTRLIWTLMLNPS